MIVKVQVPLAGSDAIAMNQAFVYNRTRKFQELLPLTDDLVALMADRPKAFFHARIEGENLVLGDEAPWQEW